MLALSIGVMIACAGLELLVIVAFGEQVKYPRHVVEADWGIRQNHPGSQYRHKSSLVTAYFRINNQGMRANYDYGYKKPEGVKRIISLGDSFTIGYEVDFEKCFSSVLERDLNASGLKVEVLNCGVSGFSNAEQYLYLKRELLRYDPDLVVVSFFGNDLEDNVRTALFRLEGDELVEWHNNYLPAGWIGNFLNTNRFFNFLSERSNAFSFVKETITKIVKLRIVRHNQNVRPDRTTPVKLDAVSPSSVLKSAHEPATYPVRLASAIFEQLYQMLRARDIPLVIQSIPAQGMADNPLKEQFPLEQFDTNRRGISFLSGKKMLDPHVTKQPLFWDWRRSHGHWTAFSHELSGRALARLILDRNLLK